MSETLAALLRTIVLGSVGALLAQAAGIPAAPLIGASLAVSIAAWAGVRVRMHPRLRNIGFAGIGVSLGAGVRPTLFHDIAPWALSLALLAVSLGADAPRGRIRPEALVPPGRDHGDPRLQSRHDVLHARGGRGGPR